MQQIFTDKKNSPNVHPLTLIMTVTKMKRHKVLSLTSKGLKKQISIQRPDVINLHDFINVFPVQSFLPQIYSLIATSNCRIYNFKRLDYRKKEF